MTTVVHDRPIAEPRTDASLRTDAPPMPRRVSWGAIFAGTVIGLAIMLLLTLLGVGIGAATIDPLQGDSAGGIATGSVIFFAVVQLLSLLIGGYAAARLAGVPLKQGSMLHGVAVWALATFATFWLATTAVGTLVSGVASTVSSASQGVASAAQAAVPNDLSLSDLSAPNIDMQDLPQSVRSALEQRGLTIDEARQETRAALQDIVGQQERSRAADVATETAQDIVSSPGDAGSDIDAMVDKLFGGSNAVLSEEDKQQALTEMNERLGISEQEAEQVLNQAQEQVQQTTAEAEAALEKAQTQAAEAADTASSALSAAALGAFAASLLGLIAAVIGALIGRPKDIVDHDHSARTV